MDEKKYRVERFSVGNMTCTNCAARIETAVSSLTGVKKITVSYGKGTGTVVFDEAKLPLETIHKVITDLGYEIREGDAPAAGKTAKKAGQFIGVAVIVLAGMLLLRRTGIFNMVPEIEQTMSYSLLFIIGLITSVHCIGMCGGINLSQSIGKTDTAGTGIGTGTAKLNRVKPGLLYNLGRIISYTAVGGAVGALGSIISFSGQAQGIVVAVAGIFMVIFGLNMLGFFPSLKRITPRLPKKFTAGMNKLKSGRGPLIVGLLNGFMPCGPLQTMQLYALGTGSFIAGATSMFLFSVGTVPLMFGFGAIASLLTGKFTSKMMKVSALIVLFLGVGMLGRGFSLTGVNFQLPFGKGGGNNIAVVQEGFQEISTNVTGSSYESFVVQKGIPLKWTILVEEGELNGCNNPLTVPEFDITKELVVGVNTLEFIPSESGTIIYTCWMGMITAAIKVVDDISEVTPRDLKEANRIAAASAGGCGDGGCSDGGSCGTETSTAAATGSCCGEDAAKPAYNVDLVRTYLSSVTEDRIGFSLVEPELQKAMVFVDDTGFSPAVIVMRKDIPADWTFQLQTDDPLLSSILFPAYGIQLNMEEGDNSIEYIPSGDFVFFSPDGRAIGMVIVVDDSVNLIVEDIVEILESFGAPTLETALVPQ